MSLFKILCNDIQRRLIETSQVDLEKFLKDKEFENPKSKGFLYHGTNVSPDKFKLRDDYDWEDSNAWSGDLPEGYLFLTTDIREAKAYGEYVLPVELKDYDQKVFKVDSNNPSRAFDMDFGIDLNKPDKYVGFWKKFLDSGKRNLVIKGNNNKWTVITDIDNIIPRLDLAKGFYDSK